MKAKRLVDLASFGSAALLALAFGFQYLGGYEPCQMCLWQRWPHLAAILIGTIHSAYTTRWLAGLGALSMIGNAGLGVFHTGVERDWWEGPATCAGPAQELGGLSGGELLDFSTGNGIVMCDEAALHIVGLSMASWNAIGCAVLAGLWIWAMRRAV